MSLVRGNQLCFVRLGLTSSSYRCSCVCLILSHIGSALLCLDLLKGDMLYFACVSWTVSIS